MATHDAMFFRNGDEHDAGVKLDVTPFKWEKLTDLIRELEKGASTRVRKLHSCRQGDWVKDVRDVKPGGVYVYMLTHTESYESLPYTERVPRAAPQPVEKPKKKRKKRRPDAEGGGGGGARSDAGSSRASSEARFSSHVPISAAKSRTSKGGKRSRRAPSNGGGGGDVPPARGPVEPTEEEAALAIQTAFRRHRARQSVKADNAAPAPESKSSPAREGKRRRNDRPKERSAKRLGALGSDDRPKERSANRLGNKGRSPRTPRSRSPRLPVSPSPGQGKRRDDRQRKAGVGSPEKKGNMSRFKVLPPVSSVQRDSGGDGQTSIRADGGGTKQMGDGKAGRSRGPGVDEAASVSVPAELLGQLGPKLLAKGGMSVDTKPTLAGCDVVGMYFASSVIRACSVFAAAMDTVYKALQASGKKFEVVLVSEDKDRRAFESFVNAMPPWLHAVPFESPCRPRAKKKFAIKAVPSLLLFDGQTGNLITAQGVAAIQEDPTGEHFPWSPNTAKPVPGITLMSHTSDASSVTSITPQTAKSLTSVSGGHSSSEVPPSVIYYWLRPTIPSYRKDWRTPWPEYAPLIYTHGSVESGPAWADLPSTLNQIKFNTMDGRVNRRSHSGDYAIDSNGCPRNPMGRTGIRGRGLLGRFGPNHAADPIVSRWKRDARGNIARDKDGEKLIEVVLIKRRDTGAWAIPGGMVEAGDSVSLTLKKEFGEEAMDSFGMTPSQKETMMGQLNLLFETGVEIYKGFSDDPRNTDIAWMETVAFNFHDDDGEATKAFKLTAGDDAGDVAWTTITPGLNLYANHTAHIVKARARLLSNSNSKPSSKPSAKADKKTRQLRRWSMLQKLLTNFREIATVKVDHPANLAMKMLDVSYFRGLPPYKQAQLARCIGPGLAVGESPIGCVFASTADFAQFKPFFRPWLMAYHGASDKLHQNVHRGAKMKTGNNLAKLGLPPSFVRVRLSRNLATFPLTPMMERQDRIDLEQVVYQALQQLHSKSEFEGEYLSLTEGHSCHVDGAALDALQQDGVLFPDLALDTFYQASGQASDWPCGRGIYTDKARSFAIWVGVEDHIQINVRETAIDLAGCHEKCTGLLGALERALLATGDLSLARTGSASWSEDPSLGFITASPAHCGTGLGLGVQVSLPILATKKDRRVLQQLSKRSGLNFWSGPKMDPTMVVLETTASLGVAESDMMHKLYDGIGRVLTEETRLAAKSHAPAAGFGGTSRLTAIRGSVNMGTTGMNLMSTGVAAIPTLEASRLSEAFLPEEDELAPAPTNERSRAMVYNAVAERFSAATAAQGLAAAMEVRAATKIQASFRGFQIRKSLAVAGPTGDSLKSKGNLTPEVKPRVGSGSRRKASSITRHDASMKIFGSSSSRASWNPDALMTRMVPLAELQKKIDAEWEQSRTSVPVDPTPKLAAKGKKGWRGRQRQQRGSPKQK